MGRRVKRATLSVPINKHVFFRISEPVVLGCESETFCTLDQQAASFMLLMALQNSDEESTCLMFGTWGWTCLKKLEPATMEDSPVQSPLGGKSSTGWLAAFVMAVKKQQQKSTSCVIQYIWGDSSANRGQCIFLSEVSLFQDTLISNGKPLIGTLEHLVE